MQQKAATKTTHLQNLASSDLLRKIHPQPYWSSEAGLACIIELPNKNFTSSYFLRD